MTATEILQSKVLLQDVEVVERPYDDRFTLLELKGQNGAPFNLFYYIVDGTNNNIYYGSPQLPDGVNVERIKRGLEQPA